MLKIPRGSFALCFVLVLTVSAELDARPRALSVTRYQVELQGLIDDTPETFNGRVILSATALDEVNTITLNAANMSLPYVRIRRNDTGATVPVKRLEYDIEKELAYIHLESALLKTVKYEIDIQYQGHFSAYPDKGLARTSYLDEGKEKWLVVMRPGRPSARRVFPCVDEAGQEARFSLSVWRPTPCIALSNTPLKSSEVISANLRKDTFEPTDKMLPSQLSLVVAELHQVNSTFPGISFWGRSEVLADLQPAVSAVPLIIDAMQNLTNSSLTLPYTPLAVVALPNLGDAGGAPGLLALSESSLTWGTPLLPSAARQSAFLSLVRGLVDPEVFAFIKLKDWGQAWATDGLAAHLQYLLANHMQKAWMLKVQQVSQVQAVLDRDASSGAKSLRGGAPNSAAKGAAVLRMMELAVNVNFTVPVFGRSVKRFYNVTANCLVDADDLYDTMEKEYDVAKAFSPGVTVNVVLNSWSKQAGYPVVHIIRNYTAETVTFTQERFYAFKDDRPSAGPTEEWWLPIALTSQDPRATVNSTPSTWLVPGENNQELQLHYVEAKHWLYANYKQSGLYRVNYDIPNWLLLTEQLTSVWFDKISVEARAQLLGDAMSLARAELLEWPIALDLSTYIAQEHELLPWMTARREFQFLAERLAGSPALGLLQGYQARLLKNVFLDAVFDLGGPPSHDQRVLRETLYVWACEVGFKRCHQETERLYRDWKADDKKRPDADLVLGVLCEAVRRDGLREWLHAMRLLGSSTLAPLRERFIRAAACTQDIKLLTRLVNNTVSDSGPFLRSEVTEVLTSVSAQQPFGWPLVSQFLLDEHQNILTRTGSKEALERVVHSLAVKTVTPDQLDKISELAAKVQESVGASEIIQQAVQVATNSVAWNKRNADKVADWLRVIMNATLTESVVT